MFSRPAFLPSKGPRKSPRAPAGDYALGMSFALLTYFLFSSNDAIVRLASQHIAPPLIVLGSSLVALPMLLIFFKLRGEDITWWPQRPRLVIFRTILGGITAMFAFSAFQRLPLADAYVFIFTMPLFLTGLSVLVLKEQIGWRRWSAVGVGFLGVVIAFQPGRAALDWGHLYALCGAMTGSLSLVILRIVSQTERRPCLAIWQFPGSIVLPLLLMALAPVEVDQLFSGQVVLLLLISGLVITTVQLTLIITLRSLPPSQIAPLQYSQILWGVSFGWLLFGDWPQPSVWFGLVLIVGSGVYTWHRERVRIRLASAQNPPARI